MYYNSKLIKANFIKRYNRFLSIHKLKNNETVIAYCPNTGSMKGLLTLGNTSYLSKTSNTNRKLSYTWESLKVNNVMVGINTQIANQIVYDSLIKNEFPFLNKIKKIEKEKKYGKNCKIDFLITSNDNRKIWLEVKSVSLSRNNKIAEFPDSVSKRALKQLNQMKQLVSNENIVIILYLIQRNDCKYFKLANDLDPNYNNEYLNLKMLGMKSIAVSCNISDYGISINFDRKVKILDE